MESIELLEARLAEALQALDEAAGLVRDTNEIETDEGLRNLGRAITYAWELREKIHQIKPGLKPAFVEEFENDRTRYEELSDISKSAHLAEKNNEFSNAEKIFKELRSKARFGYWVLVAEAGLFRILESERNNA